MSCPLPREILDLIVDYLHDDPTSLGSCCLVSKSWIHPARTHLFAAVNLQDGGCFGRWKETFPDPTNSPAHHARTLLIDDFNFATAADGCIISTFCGIVRLHVVLYRREIPLAPLYGLSPAIRSLRVGIDSCNLSEIFDLVCSLPLLEDLMLVSSTHDLGDGGWNAPSTSPRLTGFLKLSLSGGIRSTTPLLLSLPSGIHFTKIAVFWYDKEDVRWTMCLVSGCSSTLEFLRITNDISVFPSVPARLITYHPTQRRPVSPRLISPRQQTSKA